MLKKQEKKEAIAYQIALIRQDKVKKKKGHLSQIERDKITILLSEGLSIRNIASILASRVSRDIRKHNKRSYIGTGKNIPNRVDIDLRPIEANLRLEFGHFEADSIESKRVRGQKRKSCLTVLVDRATRLTRIRKTASHTSRETVLSIASIKDTIHTAIKSITYDNGKEFTQHEKINKILNTKSYFCKPYHSWEKGTVENMNGIIRRFFPKGTDFGTITTEEIKCVEDWINNRPMKVLGFKTPYEKYLELTLFS